MPQQSPALKNWRRLHNRPGGAWLFARMVCLRAPYFASISPHIRRLEPGRCEVAVSKRRAITNHIGTVHAIAMCNMAELAGGLMTDATVTPGYRWIPRGMRVEYLAKARTHLKAIAEPDPDGPALDDGVNYPVVVTVRDDRAQPVMRAVITMWVTRAGP